MLSIEVIEQRIRALQPNAQLVRAIAAYLVPVEEGGILDTHDYEDTQEAVVVDVICAADAAGYRLVKRDKEINGS